MQKQLVSGLLIGLIVGGVGGYFGAVKFARSDSRTGGFTNLSPEERQARFGQGGTRGGGARLGAGATQGEIIAKDDVSMTVKLQDGGSRIVYLSGSTTIMRSSEGNSGDLIVGEQVMVFGAPAADGTITAQSVQIRPAMPARSAQ